MVGMDKRKKHHRRTNGQKEKGKEQQDVALTQLVHHLDHVEENKERNHKLVLDFAQLLQNYATLTLPPLPPALLLSGLKTRCWRPSSVSDRSTPRVLDVAAVATSKSVKTKISATVVVIVLVNFIVLVWWFFFENGTQNTVDDWNLWTEEKAWRCFNLHSPGKIDQAQSFVVALSPHQATKQHGAYCRYLCRARVFCFLVTDRLQKRTFFVHSCRTDEMRQRKFGTVLVVKTKPQPAGRAQKMMQFSQRYEYFLHTEFWSAQVP